MDLTQIYMASPDWIKALLIVAPCLTVFGCVTVIGTRWSGRRKPAPPTKIAGYSDAGSLLEADPVMRREAGEFLLQTFEQAFLERQKTAPPEPEKLPASAAG